ncbi:MAG: trehalose-phosphatase [Candidatus Limnocylindria bacterium]
MTPTGASALGLALDALARSPSGLLADLDGTLAPIVADPAAVLLADGAGAALTALADRLAVVGIVTGRAAHDARRIIGPARALVIGNHGLEWLAPGAAGPERSDRLAAVAGTLERMLAAVPGEAGVSVDHKGLSATVHYRNAADPAAARARILGALEASLPEGIELRHGRMSVELRPVGMGDKGSAVHQVVERYGLRGLLVMGDDLTDLDMFRAAAELRAAGQLHAAIVAVGAGREVPHQVAATADAMVASPSDAVALLRALM